MGKDTDFFYNSSDTFDKRESSFVLYPKHIDVSFVKLGATDMDYTAGEELSELQVKQIQEEVSSITSSITQIELLKSYLIKRKWDLERSTGLKINEHDEKIFNVKLLTLDFSEVLEITLPFRLPLYQKQTEGKRAYYEAITQRYMQPLTKELLIIKNEYNLTKTEETFVLIIHYIAGNAIVDTDNRFHSFIFNALRYTNLIYDDNHSKLSYMETGVANAETDRVRILVVPKNYMLQLLLHEAICLM